MIRAWDEPSESQPDGAFGDASLHYEGRAAILSVTQPITDPDDIALETDAQLLARVGQLAVCADIPYVSVTSEHVTVGVTNDTGYWSHGQQEFMDFFSRVPQQNLQFCKDYEQFFPRLSLGESVPANASIDDVTGGIDNMIVRRNDDAFMSRLFFYPFDNVVFEDEEATEDWCGSPTRECTPCDVALTGRNVVLISVQH